MTPQPTSTAPAAARVERTVTAEEIAAYRDVVRLGLPARNAGSGPPGARADDAGTAGDVGTTADDAGGGTRAGAAGGGSAGGGAGARAAGSDVRADDRPGGVGGVPAASPVQPFVVAWRGATEALGSVAVDPPGAPVVHVSQEVHQRRPLRAGERVTIEPSVVGARRDPGGVRLALRSALSGEDGQPFAELVTGLLLVDATGPAPFGQVPPHPAGGGGRWETVVSRLVPADLPRRYAEVSGDQNPIHLDAAAARAAGFPGVIAHGMSVVALVAEEIVDRWAGGRADRVRSVGGRFSTPVVPGEPVDVSLTAPDERGFVRFAVKTPQGTAVKSGWVELEVGG